MLGRLGHEVRHKPMLNILVGKGTLERSLVVRLWSVDEYEVGAVIERFRERIVCVELKILTGPFRRLKCQAMVDRSPGRVGEIENPVGPERPPRKGRCARLRYRKVVDVLVRA